MLRRTYCKGIKNLIRIPERKIISSTKQTLVQMKMGV